MNVALQSVLWLGAYIAVVTAPLFALLFGPVPPPGGFWWDFSMALGFAALAMFAVQFALTARFRRASAPFGVDILYYFHRYLAIGALAIAVLHYAVVRIGSPAVLGTANPFQAALHLSAGRAALILFALLVAASLLRRRLRLEYDHWRVLHAVGATLAAALAYWHVIGTGYYIDTAWKQALWTAYGLGWIAVIVHVRLVKPWRTRNAPYRVAEVRRERGDAFTLALEPEGHAGLRFQPGQFVWLTLGSSTFALREHPFSIASSAERPERIEFAIKAVGDFTRAAMHARPGQRAYLDGPYGAFSTDRYPEAKGFVFVAGGVGIAPIIGILRTLADRGDRRPALLVYGNRRWERILYRETLETLAQRIALRVVHVVNEPPEGWTGERGRPSRALLERHLPAARAGVHAFVCGPLAMTQSVEGWLRSLGVSRAYLHSEVFEWV